LICYFDSNFPLELSDCETVTHRYFNRIYRRKSHVNSIVPMVKHYERCELIKDKFLESFEGFVRDESFDMYNTLFIDNLYEIEKNGLFVHEPSFVETFETKGVKDGITYSEYNMYTATGRPSNRHGGVNFNALNKDDGSRKPFTSRHGANGMLVQFDYDAYHLRLIADLIGYTFPDNINVHDYLGKQYFDTSTLTPEQYNSSKGISFRQLYGGVQPEYRHIPYFQEVIRFVDGLWEEFELNGEVLTPILGRKMKRSFVEKPNKNKLFNYILQATETERNMIVLNELNLYLKDKESKVILYTYDSFLIDFNMNDGKEFITHIRDIFESDGTYPTKAQVGSNYHEMNDVFVPKT